MSLLSRLFKFTRWRPRVTNSDWVNAPGRFIFWEKDAYTIFTIGPEPISSAPMQINVSWPANPPVEQVTSYDLRVTHNGTPVVHSVPPTQTSFEIQNPAQGTYAFAVRANNLVQQGSFGPSFNLTAGPSTPPAPTVVVVP